MSPAPPLPPPAPAPGVPASLVGTEWHTLPTAEPLVALTFDAGANAAGLPSILDTLEAERVPATFFLTGRWTETYPDEARRIGASYPVGNHTYSHPDLTTLAPSEAAGEITRAEEAIRAATGRDPRPMFRFPFGAADAGSIVLTNELGYGCINWTVDTRGWQGTSGGQSVELVVDRVLDALRPGAIVIMHVGSHPEDGSTLDADALPSIIAGIRARGYGFVTVARYL